MNRKNHPVGRVFAVLGITLLCLLLCLLGIIWVLEKRSLADGDGYVYPLRP